MVDRAQRFSGTIAGPTHRTRRRPRAHILAERIVRDINASRHAVSGPRLHDPRIGFECLLRLRTAPKTPATNRSGLHSPVAHSGTAIVEFVTFEKFVRFARWFALHIVETGIRFIIFAIPTSLVAQWSDVPATWKTSVFLMFCIFWWSVVFDEKREYRRAGRSIRSRSSKSSQGCHDACSGGRRSARVVDSKAASTRAGLN